MCALNTTSVGLIGCVFEVGCLSEWFEQAAELLGAARSMAIELMRQNKSNLFRRWHSRPLVKAVIESGP
ncbi:hypothetical protein BUE64_11180 [Corynebacterium diphtheriae subsp. lausannense]|nr:hypothetical protein BUE64_11180 [Corynebacterium diphtheriae subsp. lausannense]OWM39643.1 hypothetical protein AZF07_12380 [Corynebacterium diphtheriae subsp. lausannense]SNW32284.1 hypothetical protein FRC0043_01914 [Corynebacterium belfantii]